MVRLAPVIMGQSAEKRKAHAAATSSARPIRPTGNEACSSGARSTAKGESDESNNSKVQRTLRLGRGPCDLYMIPSAHVLLRLPLGPSLGEPGDHGRVGRARANGVHAYASRCILTCGGARQAQDGKLARRVAAELRHRTLPGRRRHVDDAIIVHINCRRGCGRGGCSDRLSDRLNSTKGGSTSWCWLPEHLLKLCLHAQKCATQVGIHHLVKVLD